MFTTKDQLNAFLIRGDIHLSKKDYGFFNNLTVQLSNKKPVTSNQDKLFSKLLFKYKRQFNKLGHDVDILNNLLWSVEVVPSQAEYLSAKISIENDEIVIRCPYNTRFIQKFKNVSVNCFVWQKQNKCYTAAISTHNLKIAYHEINKHFTDIKYDPNVQNILDELDEYKNCTIWEPTLVKIGKCFYIYGLNESLNHATDYLILSDEPKTLLKLSQYGVKIHESIHQDDQFKKFASDFYAVVDIEQVDLLKDWVEILKFDCIYLGADIIFNKEISKNIKDALDSIPIIRNATEISLYTNVLYVNYNSYKNNNPSFLLSDNDQLNKNISKILTIKNSRPVHVK